MEVTNLNVDAYLFAKEKHKGQKRTGSNKPYFSHCINTADIIIKLFKKNNLVNFDQTLAENIALLHDVLEDTDTTFEEIKKKFGEKIANSVQALTKNKNLSYNEQLKDSLKRISKLSNEVALVKMADRIDNLSSLNPIWDKDRALWYVEQSLLIADMLQTKCPAMSLKLIDSIYSYMDLIDKKTKEGGYMIFLQAKGGYLFAYDPDTGVTLKFVENDWQLSDISYAELSHDTDLIPLTPVEAKIIYNEKNPKDKIIDFENILKF